LHQKLLLLVLVVAAMGSAWQIQQFLKEKIDPRSSSTRFLFFLILVIAVVFLIIFITGSTIIHFKDFFFKQ